MASLAVERGMYEGELLKLGAEYVGCEYMYWAIDAAGVAIRAAAAINAFTTWLVYGNFDSYYETCYFVNRNANAA